MAPQQELKHRGGGGGFLSVSAAMSLHVWTTGVCRSGGGVLAKKQLATNQEEEN